MAFGFENYLQGMQKLQLLNTYYKILYFKKPIYFFHLNSFTAYKFGRE